MMAEIDRLLGIREIGDCSGVPSGDETFLIIPGKSSVRWIVPRNPRFGWIALRQWRAYDLLSQLKWRTVVCTAYRLKFLQVLPAVRTVALCPPSWLRGVLGDLSSTTVPVIHIGTPGSQQKLALFLVSRDSRELTAVVKLPLAEQAKAHIIHEAEMLRRLSVEFPGIAPSLIELDQSEAASVQQAIRGRQLSRRFSAAHMAFLHKLAFARTCRSMADHVTPILDRIISDSAIASRDRKFVVALLRDLRSEQLLPSVWVHGDFAPWNLMRTFDGRILATDWEFASPSGTPMFDLVYFYSIQAQVFGKGNLFPRRAKRHFGEYLRKLNIPESAALSLILLSLVQDWFRRLKLEDFDGAAFLMRHLIRFDKSR